MNGKREYLRCYIDSRKKSNRLELWNAEHPNLYRLIVELKTEDGEILEVISVMPGSGSGNKNANLDKRVKAYFKGVNRHEHDPDTAKPFLYPDIFKI